MSNSVYQFQPRFPVSENLHKSVFVREQIAELNKIIDMYNAWQKDEGRPRSGSVVEKLLANIEYGKQTINTIPMQGLQGCIKILERMEQYVLKCINYK